MLDLAEQYGTGPVQSHDIAERQDVPEPYLNQLLTLLRKAGLIISRRGPGGGHMLARPAQDMNLSEIVAALEGPLWPTEESGPGESGSGRGAPCFALREVWNQVNVATEQVLRAVSLAELLEREHHRNFSYQI